MAGLLDPSIIRNLLYLYGKENVDRSGYSIDVNRPIVFDKDGYEPHTELSATYTAKELGLPGKGYYNVPTIYNGQIFDPNADFDKIKENVLSLHKEGFKFPSFDNSKKAVEEAISRSKSIGDVRGQELNDSVEQRKRNYLMGLL